MILVLSYLSTDNSIVTLILLIKVYRLRLLGDYHHSTRIAFVEFAMVVALLFIKNICNFNVHVGFGIVFPILVLCYSFVFVHIFKIKCPSLCYGLESIMFAAHAGT